MKAQHRMLPVFKSAELVAPEADRRAKSARFHPWFWIRTILFWTGVGVMKLQEKRPFFYRTEKERYRLETDLNRARSIFFR